MGKSRPRAESLFVLLYFLDALLAQAKTPLALGLMAVFTELPFFHDTRLRSFLFNPACFTEGFASFLRRPFPYGLAVTDFSAFTSVGIGLRGRVVGVVHFVHLPK
jgi:hypothetical protein